MTEALERTGSTRTRRNGPRIKWSVKPHGSKYLPKGVEYVLITGELVINGYTIRDSAAMPRAAIKSEAWREYHRQCRLSLARYLRVLGERILEDVRARAN